jgi:hypothetical protein
MNQLPSITVGMSALGLFGAPVYAQNTAPVTADGPYVNRNFTTAGGFELSIIGCIAAGNAIHAGYNYQPNSDGGSYYILSSDPPNPPIPRAVALIKSKNNANETIILAKKESINLVLAKGKGWDAPVQVGWVFEDNAYSNVVPVYQAHKNPPGGDPSHEDYFYSENLIEFQNHWDHGWNADGSRDSPSIAFFAPLTKDAAVCFPGEPPPP